MLNPYQIFSNPTNNKYIRINSKNTDYPIPPKQQKMGNCVTVKNSKITKTIAQKQEQTVSMVHKNIHNTQSNQLGQYKIVNNVTEKLIKFRNAPLTNHEYLFNKFHHDGNRPDQVNLLWQVDTVQFVKPNLLKVSVINTVPVRMWVIVSGKDKKTMTGLYLEIQKYSQASTIDLNSISNLQQKTIRQIQLEKIPHSKDKVRIILQSTSNPSCSLYLINTYGINGSCIRLQRQELMWNSLAFELENIYNQNQQIFNGNDIKNQGSSQEIQQKQQFLCVICQEEPSTCILVPCKHMCIGRKCISNFRKMYKSCPLCKQDFQQIIIYRELME